MSDSTRSAGVLGVSMVLQIEGMLDVGEASIPPRGFEERLILMSSRDIFLRLGERGTSSITLSSFKLMSSRLAGTRRGDPSSLPSPAVAFVGAAGDALRESQCSNVEDAFAVGADKTGDVNCKGMSGTGGCSSIGVLGLRMLEALGLRE